MTASGQSDTIRNSWISFARLVLPVYWLALAFGTHLPNIDVLSGEPPPLDSPRILLQPDKGLHILGFGGLAFLLIASRLWGRDRSIRANAVLGACIALAYAAIDEWTQTYTIDRTVSLSDMVANTIAVLGVYLLVMAPRLVSEASGPRAVRCRLIFIVALPLLAIAAFSAGVFREAVRMRAQYLPAIDSGIRLDSGLHFVIAAGLAWLLFNAAPLGLKRSRSNMLLAIVLVGGSAPVIELLQHFTGRGMELRDLFAHELGMLLVMACWAGKAAIARPATPMQGLASPDSEERRQEGEEPSRFVGHAILVSALTLLSRFTGLARDAVLAAAFGLSSVADAFFIGFLIPNLFRRLFGEGALTAAFIPIYTELRERDSMLAKRFASLVMTLLAVLLIVITVVGELALWWVQLQVDPSGKLGLALLYTRMMLPYMPLICMVALAGGVLQVHKRFGPPAAAPLVLNAMMVLAVLFVTWGFSFKAPDTQVATTVALAIVLAGVIQLAWQIVVVWRVAGLTTRLVGVGPEVKRMLIVMGPMVLGLAVFQINALMDSLIAFFLAPPAVGETGLLEKLGVNLSRFPLETGDVAALQWSQRLYQFPLGVFGIAIATAIFPALSAAAAKFGGQNGNDGNQPKADLDEFATILRQGLRLTVFIGLPASVGLILVRVPLARLVYERGEFSLGDAMRVATILAGYAASVWAYAMMHTITRAFYALKDSTTPVKVGAAMVALNLAFNLTLIWPLGAAGLAWSTAISAMGQVTILILLIRRRVKNPIDSAVKRSWMRTGVGSAVMAAVLLPAVLWLDPASLSRTASAAVLLGMVAVGGGIVFLVARLYGVEELAWIRRRRQ